MTDINDRGSYVELVKKLVAKSKEEFDILDENAYINEMVDFFIEYDKKEQEAYHGGIGITKEMIRLRDEKLEKMLEIKRKYLVKKG